MFIQIRSQRQILSILFALSSALGCTAMAASAGDGSPGGSGGGDPVTLDFVNTAYTEVVPWLMEHTQDLPKPIDIEIFKTKINPKKIVVVTDVFESCDDTRKGRLVVGCFNSTTGIWRLSRSLYPLDTIRSPMKRSFIMHEVFRSMGVEGDAYEETRMVSRFQVMPVKMQSCIINLERNTSFRVNDSLVFCEETGADERFQYCTINLVRNTDFRAYDAAVSCQRNAGDERFQNCEINLVRNTSLRAQEAGLACEMSHSSPLFQSCVINLTRNTSMLAHEAVTSCGNW